MIPVFGVVDLVARCPDKNVFILPEISFPLKLMQGGNKPAEDSIFHLRIDRL